MPSEMLLAPKGAPTVIAFEDWAISGWIRDGYDVLTLGRGVCPLVAGLSCLCHYAVISFLK